MIIKRVFKIRKQKVFYLNIPNNVIYVTPKIKIELTNITIDNVDLVSNFRDEIHTKIFLSLLKDRQYGVFAKFNGKVIGHAWAKICRKDHYRVNGYMDISKNESFIHYCNVSEQFRGNNVYPSMLVYLCHRLFNEAKVSRILIDSEINNHASLKGISKVGFKPLGVGTYIQFRGRLIFKCFRSINLLDPFKSKLEFE